MCRMPVAIAVVIARRLTYYDVIISKHVLRGSAHMVACCPCLLAVRPAVLQLPQALAASLSKP